MQPSDGASPAAVVREVAIAAVVGLTAFLGWLLPQPGYSVSRLVLFGLILACAWTGALGVLLSRHRHVLVGAIGLFLLGFWQAVLWIGMLPTALALVGAASVMGGADAEGDRVDE